MKCERVKDLLAEYIDGELDKALEQGLKRHLEGCDGCRRREAALREGVIGPFKKSERVEAPEAVWEELKSRIEKRRAGAPVTEFFRARKPALVFAAALAVILIAVILLNLTFNGQSGINAYLTEQMEFLSYLEGEGEGDIFGSEAADFSTAIEEYIL